MEELDFLLKDENISEADIVDIEHNGEYTPALSIMVDINPKTHGEIKPIMGCEIILTKGDISKLYKIFKNL